MGLPLPIKHLWLHPVDVSVRNLNNSSGTRSFICACFYSYLQCIGCGLLLLHTLHLCDAKSPFAEGKLVGQIKQNALLIVFNK